MLAIIAWIVFVSAVFVASQLSSETSEVIEEAVVTPVVSVAPEIEPSPMPVPEPEPEPEPKPEPEPEESTPVREDIPLDAETQTLLYQACDETGVQYELALAVVWKETRFQNINGDNGGPSYANKMAAANKVSQYVSDVLNYMNILGGN